ncbi:hypothetical protein HPB52_011458 [Rhipicephalus sanguineus]|uniref:Uncharacterized protein n=1 Tax=Rhipicephalus sanguineus TaxID=34632 RepID=A0A9D4T3N6_RHISA|nr:hypothetical protein HPB52_011458 [Rhipicephalus sanguineus]
MQSVRDPKRAYVERDVSVTVWNGCPEALVRRLEPDALPSKVSHEPFGVPDVGVELDTEPPSPGILGQQVVSPTAGLATRSLALRLAYAELDPRSKNGTWDCLCKPFCWTPWKALHSKVCTLDYTLINTKFSVLLGMIVVPYNMRDPKRAYVERDVSVTVWNGCPEALVRRLEPDALSSKVRHEPLGVPDVGVELDTEPPSPGILGQQVVSPTAGLATLSLALRAAGLVESWPPLGEENEGVDPSHVI